MQTAEKIQDNLPKWNLDSLYSSNEDPKIKADLESLKKEAEQFERQYKGKIIELDAKSLFSAISQYDNYCDNLIRLSSYAFLQYCTKMENSEAQILNQNINENLTDITKHTIFFTLELNTISEEKIERLLDDQNL